jgi:hypothetical protein
MISGATSGMRFAGPALRRAIVHFQAFRSQTEASARLPGATADHRHSVFRRPPAQAAFPVSQLPGTSSNRNIQTP